MTGQPDFSNILTPELYGQILRNQFPWDGPVDMKFASKFYFRGVPDNSKQVFDTCHFPALKPISRVTPKVPDLHKYLPSPEDVHFPEHALGLVLLLDQGPRTIYRGLDLHYTYSFFDVASRKVVQELIAAGTFPDDTNNWTKLGYSFEDAMVRKFWLYGPLIHSEELKDQDFMTEKIEQLRKEVEDHTGTRDPWRDTREEDSNNLGLFRHLVMEVGPPETFVDFFFWLFRVFDAHRPIIANFRRYPYRNGAQGRDTTKEEVKFLEETKNFGAPPLTKKEVEILRDQVQKGVWGELSDSSPQ